MATAPALQSSARRRAPTRSASRRSSLRSTSEITEWSALINPNRLVDPFGGNAQLAAANTPIDEVRALAAGARTPSFWLGAGQGDPADVSAAEYFAQLLQLHEAGVPVDITPGGGHTMGTWHAEVPPMLMWMTKGLAAAVVNDQRVAALQAINEARKHSAIKHPSQASGRQAIGKPSPNPSKTR